MDPARLRMARESRGLTRERLAEQIGLTPRMIARYENEGAKPTSDVIASLARVLQTSADYLVGLTDDPAIPVNGGLSEREALVVAALRRGDLIEVMRVIAGT